MISPRHAQKLNICLLVPWYGGSHKQWADGLKRHSGHHITILSLPAVHWKWRMHGAAVTLAEQVLSRKDKFDLILAEDMMDVATFAALIRARGLYLPIATYFHENQISYPVSPRDTDIREGRDLRYGFTNYTSALVSNRVYFNSAYHHDVFLDSLPGFLEGFPDFTNVKTVEAIRQKSAVLPLGLPLHELDPFKDAEPLPRGDVPLLLWNHRREYDKNPGDFLEILLELKERGLTFQVALLGKQSTGTRELFQEAVKRLGTAVVHDGEVDGLAEYAAWLWRADILPVTSMQDFFGGSVIEAVYCGCHPVLPNRLAYPEHFPGKAVYYNSQSEALDLLDNLIRSEKWKEPSELPPLAEQYAWERLSACYDQQFEQLLEDNT